MKHNKDKKQRGPEEEKAMFSNLEFSYSRSKEEVWDQLEGMLDEKEDETPVVAMPKAEDQDDAKGRSISWKWMSVAASVVILISAGLFARFYTKTIGVAPGEFVSHTLPDGSEVHLNAATSISYQPFWWRLNRGVDLQGEAYFVVAKGEKFTVNAVMGSVEVLGTEFNIYARDNGFQVFCEEGRVKVTSDKQAEGNDKEVVLTQGHLASIELNHLNNPVLLKQVDAVPNEAILSWRAGRFLYDNILLSKVFEDVERQYGISILLNDVDISQRPYSGSFSRDKDLEGALETICLPLALKFEKRQEGVYGISNR